MGPLAFLDLIEKLSECEVDAKRACDYLRMWERSYDSGPSEFKAIREAVYGEISTEVMDRIKMRVETLDDILVASQCVYKQKAWHTRALASELTWSLWIEWKIKLWKKDMLKRLR
jgi:hypothetical protein